MEMLRSSFKFAISFCGIGHGQKYVWKKAKNLISPDIILGECTKFRKIRSSGFGEIGTVQIDDRQTFFIIRILHWMNFLDKTHFFLFFFPVKLLISCTKSRQMWIVTCEEWAVARWVVHNFESCFDLSNQVCADGHTKPIKAKSLFLATTWKQS